jgi:hypothetical protein
MNQSTPRRRISPLRCARRPLARLLVVILLSQVVALTARAQEEDDPVAKTTQLNRQAIEAYQGHKFDEAQKLLKQALDLCDASGLEQHPIKARTYIHLGIVTIGGLKQRDAGIGQFKKALAIQPEITLTKSLVTPDLQKAFDEAKGGGAAPPAGGDLPEAEPPAPAATPAPPPAAPPPSAAPPEAGAGDEEPAVPSTGLSHDPVTHGRPKTTIPIIVTVDSSLKFDKVVLAYRPTGSGDFFGREMKAGEGGAYSAEIPARATGGAQVVYYIEAQDKDGVAVAAIGSADKPLTIALGAQRVAGKKSGADDDGDDDDDDDDGTGGKYYLALLVGSGVGYASGNGDLDRNTSYSSGSIAVAQAGHIAPEIGYRLRPDMMLSLQLRYQYITGPTEINSGGKILHPANYALAVFAKATWLFGHGGFRPFVSLAVGGGEIRHVVALPATAANQNIRCGPNNNTSCIDTIAGGPVLAGGGAGLMFNLSDSLALVASLNVQIGAPNFTANLDGNLGFAFTFGSAAGSSSSSSSEESSPSSSPSSSSSSSSDEDE